MFAEAELNRTADAEFGAFYRAEREHAVRLAWLLTHDRASCDDVVQDAFASVYSRFGSVEHPGAYLRAAIVNEVRERGRSAGREQRRIALVTSGQRGTVEGPTGGILDAVARLPIAQRSAIVLRYWADLTVEDIALALRVRPGSVRSLLSRASKTLQKELTG
jgi:DNA-directed RNA polymerase specialized sigma24 family protein